MRHRVMLMERYRDWNLEQDEWEEGWDYASDPIYFNTFEEVVQYLVNAGYILPTYALYNHNELTQATWENIADRTLSAQYLRV